jgi:Domain of unknown function (DUF4189)
MKVWKAALLLGIVALTLAPVAAQPVWAWGAVAVGATGDLAKGGFAFGGAVDQPSEDAAKTAAVGVCRKFEGAPKMAASCKVIRTFRHQCYSLVFDPQPGMPGTAWAFAADRSRAERQAMAGCRKSAGVGRRKFCKLNQTYCDTHD